MGSSAQTPHRARTPFPSALAIRLPGGIGREDVPAVSALAATELAAPRTAPGCHPGTANCDVGAVEQPALPTLDVLARLALVARRNHRTLRLEHASPAILDLLDLCGLADYLAAIQAPSEVEPASSTDDAVFRTADAAPRGRSSGGEVVR